MRPGVWEAMAPYATQRFGNSSGIHGVSRDAKNGLEEARERIADLIGSQPTEIVFTSGGTESDNLAIKGSATGPVGPGGVVTIATEHEAVLETADFLRRSGHPTRVVEVDASGVVSPDALARSVDARTAVVSVMVVNNETGVINDIPSLAEVVKQACPTALFHTDAVQAVSSQSIGLEGVDMMSVSAHKLGGPKGIGFLYVRDGVRLEPVIHGGGQELGRRSGTHDVAGAVGLAAALELAVEDRSRFGSVVGGIRDDFEKRVTAGIEGLVVNGEDAARSPHHLNLRIPGVRNQTLLIRLDQAGVAASAGSACQSGAARVSHVLEAMGLTPDEARECVRFSFGWNTTQDEAGEAADVLIDLVSELR
jgi:cysteine desulfurase